jgi:hypothetical protein
MILIGCEKCGSSYAPKTKDVNFDTKTGIWLGQSANICDNCKEIEKSEKRNKKLESLLKPTLKEKIKKWIKNCI